MRDIVWIKTEDGKSQFAIGKEDRKVPGKVKA